MKKAVVTPNFRFTFARLKQLADGMLANLDRDAQSFAGRGFDKEKRNILVKSIADFEEFPTDEQLESEKMEFTAAKDVLRDQLEAQMRTVFNMAENKFGSKSAKYRRFGNADISHQTDDELVRSGRAMSKTAVHFLPDLSSEGLNESHIKGIEISTQKFDSAIDDVLSGVRQRDISTEDRANVANDLYEQLVKYARTGRDLWVSESEARYNDYIIYDTPTGEAEATPDGSGK